MGNIVLRRRVVFGAWGSVGNEAIGLTESGLLSVFDCGDERAGGTVNQEGREVMHDTWSSFAEVVLPVAEGVFGNDIVDTLIDRLLMRLVGAFGAFIEPTKMQIIARI